MPSAQAHEGGMRRLWALLRRPLGTSVAARGPPRWWGGPRPFHLKRFLLVQRYWKVGRSIGVRSSAFSNRRRRIDSMYQNAVQHASADGHSEKQKRFPSPAVTEPHYPLSLCGRQAATSWFSANNYNLGKVVQMTCFSRWHSTTTEPRSWV